eukprot:14033770-Ditylum_brightwellii.AAC.1
MPSTCWMQQWRQLKKQGVLKPDPRWQFLMDLTKFMNNLQDKEHELVLSLDSNEDSAKNRQFAKFMTDNDLVNAYKNMHPDLHLTTYLQGHKRLDYMLITPDFNPEVLFLGDINSAVDPAARKLKTSNPPWVDNYMDVLETFFTNQNILQRIGTHPEVQTTSQNYNGRDVIRGEFMTLVQAWICLVNKISKSRKAGE